MPPYATTQSRLENFLLNLEDDIADQPTNAGDLLQTLNMILHQANEDFAFLITMIAEDPDCHLPANARSLGALRDYCAIALSVCTPER